MYSIELKFKTEIMLKFFKSTYLTTAILYMFLLSVITDVVAQEPIIPKYRSIQIITASADLQDRNYLAFPSILQSGDDRILICYKRGTKHGRDVEANLEMIEFDIERNEILQKLSLPGDKGIVHQMGEWNQFPDGSLRIYIDAQHLGHDNDNYRTGLRQIDIYSKDGIYKASESELSPLVDGREYGYAFDFINKADTTFMLVMGFGYRPGNKWSVDVIRSVDNGQSWTFVRDLTHEFGGHHINESAFLPWGDGYVVTTREYGSNQRIYLTDKNFKLLKSQNLSEAYPYIESHIGRPRLFAKDDNLYLLGRNWRTINDKRPMELALFRLNAEALEIESWAVLDNAERANVTDGHYAVPYFYMRDGKEYFNIIDYKEVNDQFPNIERYEYLWNEVK